MSESERGWHFAGKEDVTSEGKINLPDRLFEEGILEAGKPAYWAFERGNGYPIVSSDELKEDIYKFQGYTKAGEDPSNQTTIPKIFFEDITGRGRGDDKDPVPLHARIEYGETRFFAFRTQMAERYPRSCYLFTQTEFDELIGDSDWADPLEKIPEFS